MNWSIAREDDFRRYWAAGISQDEIAVLMSCSRQLVADQARRFGLPERDIRLDKSGWTDEKIEELKKLLAEGLSTRVIATQIGMSRNAIIGKAHRLGIEGRKKPVAENPRKRSRKKAALAASPSLASPPARLLAAMSGPPLGSIPKIAAPPLVPVDGAKIGVLLLDLEYEACRWPIAESDAGHVFCGRKSPGRVYCGCHSRMAYVPARR